MRFYQIPFFVKLFFPNYIWEIHTKEKTIYITFDDGPTQELTPWILETLAAYNAKATFFCVGQNVEKHPEL
ncbi:MAG: polysaccharide deacetylase family protein, partial [Bacteroidetes bacterium]|nr:polysaccharide deacetylase family protein [Bacteroidota bacterium]